MSLQTPTVTAWQCLRLLGCLSSFHRRLESSPRHGL